VSAVPRNNPVSTTPGIERIARSKAAKVVSIRLPECDLKLARSQAAKKGLPYQTYIKSLLHQALEQGGK